MILSKLIIDININIILCKNYNTLYGFCRLRLSGNAGGGIFPELKGSALVRELKVYGSSFEGEKEAFIEKLNRRGIWATRLILFVSLNAAIYEDWTTGSIGQILGLNLLFFIVVWTFSGSVYNHLFQSNWFIHKLLVPPFIKKLQDERSKFHSNNSNEIDCLRKKSDEFHKYTEIEEIRWGKINRVIDDFGKTMTQNNIDGAFFDVKILPHDKEVILKAIEIFFKAVTAKIKEEPDKILPYSQESAWKDHKKKLAALETSIFALTQFQPNVGIQPILNKVGVLNKVQKLPLDEDKKIAILAEAEEKLDPRLPRLLELAEKDNQKFHEMLA